MSYKSVRRKKYEEMAWKGMHRDYKVRRVGGTKMVMIHQGGMTVLAPLHAISHKDLLKLVPRAHLRTQRHWYKTQARRSR